MRKITIILLAVWVLAFAACNNTSNEDTAATSDTTANIKKDSTNVEITEVSFETLTDSLALVLTNRMVKIAGIVDHVCKHGGKRLFIVGSNPGERLKVEAGDNPPFNAELVGTEIEVIGILHTEKIDSTYLANWENELMEKENEGITETEKKHIEKAHVEDEDHDHHEGEHEGTEEIEKQIEQINRLKQIINNNEQGYIVSKYIMLKEYREIK